MIVTLRRTIGRLALLGGAGLLLYQLVHWKQHGTWVPYPLGLVPEGFMHVLGTVMSYLPFVTPEGVDMFLYFHTSQLPGPLFRFFDFIPLSGFCLVTGYFCLRWEKYLG